MQEQHTCGNCANIGEEVREDWMLHDEHYHECPIASPYIGLVEECDTRPCWNDDTIYKAALRYAKSKDVANIDEVINAFVAGVEYQLSNSKNTL